jgi:GT2 family glycosyltransferase
MKQFKKSNQAGGGLEALRAENAALRIALGQAQEFSINKEKKSIEYIFHLGQFKSRLAYRLENWLKKIFRGAEKSDDELLPLPQGVDKNYLDWLTLYEPCDDVTHSKIRAHILRFLNPRTFTLILDCRSGNMNEIETSLNSLSGQIYQNFELILWGDKTHLATLPSTSQSLKDTALKLAVIDQAKASSFKDFLREARLAITGDYVALLSAGDQLHATAFYEFAAELDIYPETQILYSDEDRLDFSGNRTEPYFKPDWNVELFLGQNYVGSFCLIARERIFAIIQQKECVEGYAKDPEVIIFNALLNSPREAVRHIPAVLLHRKTKADEADWTRRTAQLTHDYLASGGVKSEVTQLSDCPDWVEVRRERLDPSPLVTIIIPTRNRPDLLSVSLRGVLSETSYKNIEVIIVDHENDHPGVIEIFASYLDDARVTILPYSGVFDHSNMNNRAALIARGDILLFLNDDIEVIEPDWLTHMVAQLAQEDCGVVGARLLYPDRRIQHAGVILGFGGVAGHGAVGLGANEQGYFGRVKLASEVSALTGACMAMRRALFEEVGGFSARDLQRTFNDVDLCLKARAKGKVNIYTPLATLIHHESATAGGDVKLKHYERLQREVGYMLENWGLMRSDPYYNVNLALKGESFSLAFPPRRVAPWQAVGIS